MFNKYGFTFGLFLTSVFLIAQSRVATAQDWINNIQNDTNFYSIQKAFYSSQDKDQELNTEGEEGPDELYKRWEHMMLPRISATGQPPVPDIVYKEWAKYQANHAQYKKSNKNGDWNYVAPIGAQINNSNNKAGGGGTGRINCLRFDPNNSKTMWAGTPSGGLWKSTNGGTNWSTNTDNLPNLGVTDLAINPRNTDTMFMGTGDAYGFTLPNKTFRGGLYSNGVMRSVDGGNTWDTTFLNWDRALVRQVYRIIIYPENPNVVIALTSNGIWRSIDGGNQWKKVLIQTCTDIKMKVSNHSTMYAGGSSFYVSKDTGATWTKINITFPIVVTAMTLSTCPSNDSMIYALLVSGFVSSSNTTLIRSTDNGKTWTTMSRVTQTTFQGYYDAAINVNPQNANEVTIGGVEMFRSTDGGMNWFQITYSQSYPSPAFSHADHRVLEYYPGSKDTLFDGNDGGLFMSRDGGTTWKIISLDIQVLEFYRVGSSITVPTLLYAGAQDNGTVQWYSGQWGKVIGGDGMTAVVNWEDPSIAYGSYQGGYFQKTTDFGATWTKIFPPGAGTVNWTAPFAIDPRVSSTLYFGGVRLYQSTDEGNSWTNISKGIKLNGNISNIAIAPLDNQTIYVSIGEDEQPVTLPALFRTNDGGTTWTNISNGLTKSTLYLTGIAVDRRDPKHIAVTFSGYTDGQKVFVSHDGGTTYTNISAGLPNLPVNCVAFESSNENGLFVGTEVGVFYKNDNIKGWLSYNNGLPAVIVDQIEVFPAAYKIRAATYGRGIWDGTLSGQISGISKLDEIKNEINIYPNPSETGVFSVQLPKYKYSYPSITIYNAMGLSILPSRKLEVFNEEGTSNLDLSFLPAGIYTVQFGYADGVANKKVQIVK